MLQFFAKRLKEIHEVGRDERGFTLIELLVVIIIIGILAAIAIPAFLAQREQGWEAAAQSDLRNAAAAATSCAVPADGDYTGCADETDLQEFGFNPTDDVTYDNTTASTTAWAATTVHDLDADDTTFEFDTADGSQVRCITACD